MNQIKRAIIVAAGEGSRLRPVTLTTPKPLVKVNGVRIIDTIIDALKANGIHEIYIVSGYKKEQFFEIYNDDPDITVIENPRYLNTNNVTSLYLVREHLQDAFIIEGDLLIHNPEIFNPFFEKSAYLATYMESTPEWALTLNDGTICSYSVSGGKNSHRLWGVSMWTREDGEKLSELLRKQVEEIGELGIYWDELALPDPKIKFNLGIREISLSDILEIDTFEELKAVDSSYNGYH